MFNTYLLSPLVYAAKPSFVQLDKCNEVVGSLSYQDFFYRVKSIQNKICKLETGKPVLLIFSDEVEFLIVFVACQFAGHIVTPTFFPNSKRHYERLKKVIDDCKSDTIICEDVNLSKIKNGLKINDESLLKVIPYSFLKEETLNTTQTSIQLKTNEISFIQYTSGSTGNPKGVIVSQENLSSNQQIIKQTFSITENSKILSWLPFYHDMGLIGNLLQTLYSGATCYLIKPMDFMQTPNLWLEAISKYRITHTGGPNFSFDYLLNKLKIHDDTDLSSLQILYNGSEPIKQSTLNNVVSKLAPYKFKNTALYVCYGLAEATLLVAAGNTTNENTNPGIASGNVCKTIDIKIIDSKKLVCVDGKEGEICIKSNGNTKGYWGSDDDSLFLIIEGETYLRSGDLGFLVDSQLYVTGRIKEIIIINGKNHFPYDLEKEIADQIEEIETNATVVTSDNENSLYIFAELSRSADPSLFQNIVASIIKITVSSFGIEPVNVVLISGRRIPRTSSGKLQRNKCLTQYLNKELEVTYEMKPSEKPSDIVLTEKLKTNLNAYLQDQNINSLENYINALFCIKLHLEINTDFKNNEINLFELGVDSLKAVEIVNKINEDLKIQVEFNKMFSITSVTELIKYIDTVYWLKFALKEDNEIVI
jgi:acyl-CoA synthetase (AMP-forming)/AMP-acid ligase II/acyl carrier protein